MVTAVFTDEERKYMDSIGIGVAKREQVSRERAKSWVAVLRAQPYHKCKDRLLNAFLLVGGR